MKRILLIPFLFGILNFSINSQTESQWKTAYKFSGTSNENTDDIIIKSNKWRIVWIADKQYEDIYGGNFIVILVDSKENEDLIINTIPYDGGKTIIRKKGTFYLKIQSVLVKWKIEIQEYINN